MSLKEQLLREDRTVWLDVGSGGNFEEGFYYLDVFPEKVLCPRYRDRYFRVDILKLSQEDLTKLGKFDLVRMQHALEHFSYEEGQQVLANCGKLLKKGGVLLITVPDLRIHIQKYLNHEYQNFEGFKDWAHKRIPQHAPDSFYFSIFAHSMPYESHKWCYDYEGVKFQLEMSECYEGIYKLDFGDPLSEYPFTHNRPGEDLCVVATKK